MKINKLKRLRLERGLSQVELSYRARVGVSSISAVERGLAKPWPNFRAKIAAALELPEAEIFDADESEEMEVKK